MSFDELHPAVQHHLVNSLGWRSLRPLQEEAIEPIITGEDVLIVGPTAGGKTEAAVLPLLSRMLADEWIGLSTLYVSPLRALANDVEQRLEWLLGLHGRRAAAWHGDTGPGRRRGILREPPDLLITTPESLEVMLVSTKVDHARLFSELRAVIVDEIHSFGADDRGWHLAAVLARIEFLLGRRLQRVGLSATVGNPDELLTWLKGIGDSSAPPRRVVGGAGGIRAAELRADFVGSLPNAAKVIAGLHRGEKRLVFCDSRSDVERLAATLRELKVQTFVSHSSLSRDERRQAEGAFAEGSDCVIVATSTLELGIDVGDLDRVIQIDAPTSVASFLQRMGRTGRRPSTTPNMLFLTTKPEYLLRALGLALLWGRGFVEAVKPPARPLHILGQQLLALCLQEGRLGSQDWFTWIRDSGIAGSEQARIITRHMRAIQMLESDQEMLFIGETAEKAFGRRHFMELVSVFTSSPLIEVRHGREHLGSVHESTFIVRGQRQPVLLLAGRSWGLEEIDWKRRIAYVVPAKERGVSRWIGAAQPLGFELCRTMRDVLSGDDAPAQLSKRGTSELASLREQFQWVSRDSTTLATEEGRTRWWTFAGTLANLEFEWRLGELSKASSGADELSIPVRPGTTSKVIRNVLAEEPAGALPVDRDALVQLKFSECLPFELAEDTLRQRALDPQAVATVTTEPVAAVTVSG